MKIIKEFILREIAGECVMVPTGDTTSEFNGMVNLSETGKFIWEHLDVDEHLPQPENQPKTAQSLDEMVEMMMEEYDVEEKVARQDTIRFISGLLARGFVALTKEDRTW